MHKEVRLFYTSTPIYLKHCGTDYTGHSPKQVYVELYVDTEKGEMLLLKTYSDNFTRDAVSVTTYDGHDSFTIGVEDAVELANETEMLLARVEEGNKRIYEQRIGKRD